MEIHLLSFLNTGVQLKPNGKRRYFASSWFVHCVGEIEINEEDNEGNNNEESDEESDEERDEESDERSNEKDEENEDSGPYEANKEEIRPIEEECLPKPNEEPIRK